MELLLFPLLIYFLIFGAGPIDDVTRTIAGILLVGVTVFLICSLIGSGRKRSMK
jgi:hypothetical protein